MTDKCCKCIQQQEDPIAKFNKAKKRSECELDAKTKQIEGTASNLKTKLDEANANIAILRAFVSQTSVDLTQERPSTPKKPKCEKIKDTIDELMELIVKLNAHQHQAKTITERCMVAVEVFDEIDKQKCYCALVTESCEKIKQELSDLLDEKDELDNLINEIKNPTQEPPPPTPVTDMLNGVKASIQEIKGCTILACPKLKSTAVQSAYAGPSKLPRLTQPGCCPMPCDVPKKKPTSSRGCGSGCGS